MASGLLNGLARSDIFLSFWETTAGMREAARPFVQAVAQNINEAAAQVADQFRAADQVRFSTGQTLDASIAAIERNLPQGVVFTVGSSWHFQAWFREVFSSNTTDGIEVMFR